MSALLDYELGAAISTGLTATVFAVDRRGVSYGLKACLKQGNRDLLAEEYRLLSQFCHPNIVRVYEYLPNVQLPNTPGVWDCMVMERGEIDLLDLLLRDGPMKPDVARKYFVQMTAAIRYLHALGVVHSDVKCENFVLMRDDTIRLVDFGFSFRFRDEETVKNSSGTALYAAPEQLYRRAHRGPEVDIWALGCCLYAMLTSAMAVCTSSEDPFRAIRTGLKFPKNCPPSLRSLVGDLLLLDCEKRMTSLELSRDPRLSGP